MNKQSSRGWVGPVFLLLAAAVLLAVAARFDLVIDQTVYSPSFPLAVLMEAVGWWPLYLPILGLGALWLNGWGNRVLGLILLAGGSAALWIPAFSTFHKRGWLQGGSIVMYACMAATVLVAALWGRIPATRGALRLRLVCGAGVWMMIVVNAAANLLKVIWNRARFDEMLAAGSFDGFTPWYLPFGNGGSSFPSGHTAAACGVLLVLLAMDVFPSLAKHRTAVGVLCTLYIALMAVCRVMIGRHFLSDTVAAALLGWALYAIARRTGVWKSALVGLRDRLGAI